MRNSTVNQLIDKFKAFAVGHKYIRTFHVGELQDTDLTKNMTYPIMRVQYNGVNPVPKQNTYNFTLWFADLPRRKDEKNQNIQEIHSDMTLLALDFLKEVHNGLVLFGDNVQVGTTTVEAFTDEQHHFVSGVAMDVQLLVPDDWNACIIPADYAPGGAGYPSENMNVLALPIYDEGNFIVDAYDINFVGSGVTVTKTGNRAIVTITGGGGGGGLTCDDLATCTIITTINTNISALDSAVNALESNVSGIQAQVTALDASVTSLETEVAGKQDQIIAGTTGQYYRGDKTFQDLNKAAVGLGNVDNTSDAAKPISTATQTALDGKENTITAGTTSQYYRGDKTFQTLNGTAVSNDSNVVGSTVKDALNTIQAELDINTLVALSGSNITTTSATLVDVTGLVTPTLPANSAWYFEIFLATTCTGAGGIRFGFTTPSGATGFLYVEGISTGLTGFQSTVTTGTITGVGVTRVNGSAQARLFGRISIDATAGAVQVQFASGTAGQTSTIGAGNGASMMRLTRVA
jgi:hypothetical protein